MNLREMRAARARGKSKTDWARVRRLAKEGREPARDRDSPDASKLIRSAVATRKRGRPAGSGKKEQVAIRVDREVLAAFRATGPGWQTRMNVALKAWIARRAA
jgi:uncharacterized protein (DUF4415 family)